MDKHFAVLGSTLVAALMLPVAAALGFFGPVGTAFVSLAGGAVELVAVYIAAFVGVAILWLGAQVS